MISILIANNDLLCLVQGNKRVHWHDRSYSSIHNLDIPGNKFLQSLLSLSDHQSPVYSLMWDYEISDPLMDERFNFHASKWTPRAGAAVPSLRLDYLLIISIPLIWLLLYHVRIRVASTSNGYPYCITRWTPWLVCSNTVWIQLSGPRFWQGMISESPQSRWGINVS